STYTDDAATAGISINYETNANIYNNTVLLDFSYPESSSNQNISTALLYIYATSDLVDIKNNIFVNKTNLTNNSNANSKAVSIFYKKYYEGLETTYAPLSNSNNNLYYSGTPGSKNVIFFDGTNSDQTLNAYKTRVSPKESLSVTENPPFISGVSPYNLRINSAIATRCESGASEINEPFILNTDYDGEARFPHSGYPNNLNFPATAPDIGADEFAGEPIDGISPVITYTALLNSSSNPRAFGNVTITDNNEIDVNPGSKPRLYYKKSTDDNAFVGNTSTDNGWKWTEATNSSSPFSFSFDYSILNGAVPAFGTVIQYFVVAQDNAPAPNVGSNPVIGFSADNVNSIISAPTTPNSFTFVEGLSGDKHIGVAQSTPYNTITNAVNYLCANEIVGPLNFILDDELYSASETFPITITSILGSSSTNTLTIKPNTGVNPTIQGNHLSSVIYIYGADNIIFDGANDGSTSQNLTLYNSYTTNYPSVISIKNHNEGLGATNITIKNSYIKGILSNYSVESRGIYIFGTGNNNITISNNKINLVHYGIYAQGYETTESYLTNLNITNNTIGGDARVKKYGIYTYWVDGANILNNTIKNILTIYDDAATEPTGIYIDRNSKNVNILKNSVSNVYREGYTSYQMGAKGILLYPNIANANINVINNEIYNIKGYYGGTSSSGIAGIWLSGTSSGFKIYNNTINLYGSTVSGSSQSGSKSSAIYIYNNVSGIDLRNNIFVNTQYFSSGNSHNTYAIYSDAPRAAFSNIDYNDYFVQTSGNITTAHLGRIGGTNIESLADWQAATQSDAHSLSINPEFNSNTNLKPDPLSPMINVGTPLPDVTTDLLGTARDATNPTLGAYEEGVDERGPIINYTNLPNCSALQRTINQWASITDFSEVNTNLGSRPRLYFRKNGNNNSFSGNTSTDNGWKWVEATNTSSPFSFDLDLSLIYGGVLNNDLIYYFVVAEDLHSPAFVNSNPLEGFVGTGVSDITSAPSNPNGFYFDNQSPTITYTPLANTSGAETREVENTITITDNFSIPTEAAFLPRLYYKKSTEDNVFIGNTSSDNGWKWVAGTKVQGNNYFNFVINYSLLNSALAYGDIIQYFVGAVDRA
ncbi:MAG TPA: right-handed parallel beta-helix repeat-containing protein, partial [Candidatus Kapabacteria bacterium]|nr:right-handed parallel beta-helix repeat-containing protein [Candidatus Kapabacteria bacterium]